MKDFYQKLDKLMKQLMRGVPHIPVDIGLLNEVMIEIHHRMKEEEQQTSDNIQHALTNGGYIEDCEGNACCDGTPVIFPSSTVTLPTAKCPEHIAKGVLRWNIPNLTFMIQTADSGYWLATPASAVPWFKKEPGYNMIVNKMCQAMQGFEALNQKEDSNGQ